MSLLNTNNCYFVGKLVEVKELEQITYGPNKDKEAVSATIVVKCDLGDGKESLTELRKFTNKYNKDGSQNKNYNSILNIKDLLNERVVKFDFNGENISKIHTINNENEEKIYDCGTVFSSMPVKDLVCAFNNNCDERTKEIAQNLPYRDFMTLGLLVD